MGQALCVCSRGTVSLGGARYLLLQRLAEGCGGTGGWGYWARGGMPGALGTSGVRGGRGTEGMDSQDFGRDARVWRGCLGTAAIPTRRSAPRRGFSYVDLVEGLRDGRFYALKRILCHDKEDRQAALHEVEMHNLFQHPNILRLEAHCLVEKGAKHEAWLLLPYVKVREWPPALCHAGLW